MASEKRSGRTTTKQLAGELRQAQQQIEELRGQIERGLRFVHVVATNNQGAIQGTQDTLNGLGHVLAKGGHIDPTLVQQARDAYSTAANLPPHRVRVGPDVDKYGDDAAEVVIDCEARWHLCRAACCRLGYVLGTQDLEEGVMRWDYGTPYVIKKDAAGWCTHLSEGCKCTVRSQRPLSCRRYDCRGNAEIWIDFARRIPNPKVADLPPVDRDE